ncbi:DUF4142 domain-containing protein [Flavobacterium longum]|uniref:DUF4142 domain-containing protein n=1 Tax=Flavobacterium longum TaxID=1299340 RepID=UPI0039E77BB8
MKKIEIVIRSLFLASAIVFFAACKDNKETDTKEIATEQNEEKFDENDSKEDDSEFLVAAAETDLMEIEIGKLAQSKGTAQGVKDFGKMLVDEHTKSAADTKPFADKLNVSLPLSITEKGQERYNELSKEAKGKDFDRKFADMMVKGHEDALEKMKKAADDANDPDVRAWAAGMVPTLAAHLEQAKILHDQINQ